MRAFGKTFCVALASWFPAAAAISLKPDETQQDGAKDQGDESQEAKLRSQLRSIELAIEKQEAASRKDSVAQQGVKQIVAPNDVKV